MSGFVKMYHPKATEPIIVPIANVKEAEFYGWKQEQKKAVTGGKKDGNDKGQ